MLGRSPERGEAPPERGQHALLSPNAVAAEEQGRPWKPLCMCVTARQPGDSHRVLLGWPGTYQPPNVLPSSLSQTPWAPDGLSQAMLCVGGGLGQSRCPCPPTAYASPQGEAAAESKFSRHHIGFIPKVVLGIASPVEGLPTGQSKGQTWGHHGGPKCTPLGLLHLPVPHAVHRPALAGPGIHLGACTPQPGPAPSPESSPPPRENSPAGSLARAPRLVLPHHSCRG